MKPPRTFEGSMVPERLRYYLEQMSKVVSNISFGTTTSNADADQNVSIYKTPRIVSPIGVNVSIQVSHTLTHVPFGFSVVYTSKAAHVYDSGASPWTAATQDSLGYIYVACDVGSVQFGLIIY